LTDTGPPVANAIVNRNIGKPSEHQYGQPAVDMTDPIRGDFGSFRAEKDHFPAEPADAGFGLSARRNRSATV
jgi:hypothetical protein